MGTVSASYQFMRRAAKSRYAAFPRGKNSLPPYSALSRSRPLLRLGRGAENRAAVFLHRRQPAFDIGRALVELGLHPDLSAEHAVADLRDQLLEGIGLAVAEPAQSVQPLRRTCPVGIMPTSA